MEFPIYQAPYLGNGMVIGLNAVLHVYISHGLAIGAFAVVVWSEWLSRTVPSAMARAGWDRYAHRLLRFVVLTVTVAGAVTGVGIWLTISALAPRATGSMLRIFFWPWFLEALIFLFEVLLILWLYYNWNWLGQRGRLRTWVGVGYVILAVASAVAITGIIAFMLTSGEWPTRRTLAAAFFNPTFVPQLLARLGISFSLGALFGLVFVLFTRETEAIRDQALLRFGILFVVSVAVLAVASLVYFYRTPLAFTQRARFAVLTSHLSQYPELLLLGNLLALGLILAMGVAALSRSQRLARLLAIPSMIALLAWVAQFERIREFVRGPYLMPDYMYANTILVQERAALNQTGIIRASRWNQRASPETDCLKAGAVVFARNCSACHTVGGLNDIRDRLRGRTEDGIRVLLDRTHEMVSFMPPLSGNTEERRAVARFLYALTTGKVELKSHARYHLRTEETGYE